MCTCVEEMEVKIERGKRPSSSVLSFLLPLGVWHLIYAMIIAGGLPCMERSRYVAAARISARGDNCTREKVLVLFGFINFLVYSPRIVCECD